MVSADESFLIENGTFLDRGTDPLRSRTSGHWQLISTETNEIVYDSIPHLIETLWCQETPYNAYCPRVSPQDTNRCPAGCVAIAVAQMLYFLHYNIGAPEESPGVGVCTGTVATGYSQYFGSFSSGTWDNMIVPFANQNEEDVFAALLIGDIGKKLHTEYHDTASTGMINYIKDSVLVSYGVDCSYLNDYDEDIIASSLVEGYPLLCAGSREVAPNEPLMTHVFLIDSYKRHRTEYTSTYQWVYDNPEPGVLYPPRPNQIQITYGAPYVSYYQFNWGYGEVPENDTWCAINGYWQYGNRTPYCHYRRLFYDFYEL